MKQIYVKGYKFMMNADQCEILDRADYLTLTTVITNQGLVYYDISKVLTDGDGREHFQLSPNNNGLVETVQGAQKTPKSLEAMQIKFNELIEGLEMSRRAKEESKDNFNKKEDSRAKRIGFLKNSKDDLRTELARLTNNGIDLEDVLTSKKVHGIALQLNTIEKLLDIIR